MFGFDSLIER